MGTPVLAGARYRFATLVVVSALALFFGGVATSQDRVAPKQGLGKGSLSSSRSGETGRTIPAAVPQPSIGRFSDERIRLLNRVLTLPSSPGQFEAEFSSLQVLHLRFNRRYGANSVASRSVRDRLEQLRVAWRSGR